MLSGITRTIPLGIPGSRSKLHARRRMLVQVVCDAYESHIPTIVSFGNEGSGDQSYLPLAELTQTSLHLLCASCLIQLKVPARRFAPRCPLSGLRLDCHFSWFTRFGRRE